MKICAISDIHGYLKMKIPKCDVLLICGDIINLNDQRNLISSEVWFYNKFLPWIKELDCKKVIITPGNHDFYLENKYKENYDLLKTNFKIQTDDKAIILIDELYIYNNIKFYGTPWIVPIGFQENVWAFSKKLDNNNKLNDIPTDIDVLITHDSPYHNNLLLDKSYLIKYHFYGHWHNGEDDIKKYRFNCSIVTDNYNLKSKFILPNIDINEVSINKEEIKSMKYSKEELEDLLGKIIEKILLSNNEDETKRLSIIKFLIEDKIKEFTIDELNDNE